MAAFTLSKEENLLVRQVHELAVTKIAERGAYLDTIGDDKVDWHIPQMLAKMNILAPTVPAEYGGRGLGMLATCHIIEELAAGCAGAAAIAAMNVYALTPVLIAGSEELKREFLPALCMERPHLACTAISETMPEFDLDRREKPHEEVTRISTTAAPDGDRMIINGSKDFVMNGAAADFAVVFARSKASKHKSQLQMLLVPTKTPGVEIGRALNKIGMRSCHTALMNFNNVSIPLDYQIGRPGGGYFLLTQTFDRNLPLIGAVGVGIARSAYELAVSVARSNKLLNRESPMNKYVTSALAEMCTIIDAAWLTVMRAAYFVDIDENYSRVAYMAKLYATQVAQQVASQAVDIIGRMGFTAGHPAEKYLRDAQILSMIAGSEFLHKRVLSEQL